NTSVADGGALAIGEGAGQVMLRGVKFTNNVSSASGGAVAITHSDSSRPLKLQMQYMEFRHNHAATVGGAISYNGASSGRLLGAELLFEGNTAVEGGAVWWPVGAVDIDRGIFTANSAGMRGGGLVHYGAFGPSALSNCLMTRNNAPDG